MANTTNFGWETPDDTDLVKDGAAAIRTLGSAIDTSLVDLKGGTTGQVLSKATNTDMDFTWVTSDDANAIQNAIVDAKGDLIAASAADTPARLAVGTNGKLLMADSAEATGLKWATDPTADVITTAGDLIYGTAADTVTRLGIGTAGQVLQVNSGATAPEWAAAASSGMTLIDEIPFTSANSISVNDVFSSTYTNYRILIIGATATANTATILLRLRASGSDTVGSNYRLVRIYGTNNTAASSSNPSGTDDLEIAIFGNTSYLQSMSIFDITNPNVATTTALIGTTGFAANPMTDAIIQNFYASQLDSTQFDGFTIRNGSSGVDGLTGRISVYGYKKE